MTPIEVASAVERIFRGAWISSLLAKKPARLVSVACRSRSQIRRRGSPGRSWRGEKSTGSLEQPDTR